jgi:hypothetical protein
MTFLNIVTCGLAGSSPPSPQSGSRSSTFRSSEDPQEHRRGVPFPHIFTRHHSDKHEEVDLPIANTEHGINYEDTDINRRRSSFQVTRLQTTASTCDSETEPCPQTLNLVTQIDGNLSPAFS